MPDDLMSREFLGQGLAFPLQVNQRGEVALAKGPIDIEQSIRIILGTYPGERVMRPEFGCRAKELLFAPLNTSTLRLMEYHVRRALRRWEPRITLIAVTATPAPGNLGEVLIEIDYEIKASHAERSIVYPFYIMGEEA